MILPIGHDESKVRRLPWVTFGLMGIFTLITLITPRSALENLVYPEATLEDAANYWLDHPYLSADPEVIDEILYGIPEEDHEDYIAAIHEEADALRGDEARAELGEQMELERLTDYALGRALRRGAEKNPYRRFGLVPAKPKLYAFLTHIFLHAGWIHLLGNLFMLFIAGPAVEDRWGRPLFAGFFLLSGILSGAFFMMAGADSLVPLVGASGAIAGVMGAFLTLFATTRIRFAYFYLAGLRPVHGTFEAAAWVILPVWFANEVFQGLVFSSMGVSDGFAYWAHVGGFLSGAGMAFALVKSGAEEQYILESVEAKVAQTTPSPALEQALELREQGKAAEAMTLLGAALDTRPDDRDVQLAYWEAASACDQSRAASGAMLRLIHGHARGGEMDLAIQFWRELMERVPSALADPDTLLRMVPKLIEGKHRAQAVQAFRQMVDSRNRGVTAGLALRILDHAREIDPPSALRAAEVALQSSQMDPSKRERIEQQVAELRARGVAPALDWEADHEEESGEAWATQEAIELAPDPLDDLLKAPPRTEIEEPRALELSADGDLATSMGDGTLANLAAEIDTGEPVLLAEAGSDPIATPDGAYELAGENDAAPVPLTLPPLDTDISSVPRATAHSPAPKPTSQLPALGDSPSLIDEIEAPAVAPPPSPVVAVEPTPIPAPETPPVSAAELLPIPVAPPAPIPAAPPPSIPAVPAPQAAKATDPSLTDIELQVLEALSDSARFSSAKVVEAVPTQLSDTVLYFELPGGRKSKLEYSQMQGVAVAAVDGLSTRSVVLVDLLLNWTEFDQEILRVIRMRSNAFNPCHLAGGIEDPSQAFRWFVSQILERSGGTALPSREAASGNPFQSFADLGRYERDVLDVESS